LGTYVTSDLRPSRQCAQASQKAMSVLGMIKRNFRRITVHDFKILYKSYVRPHLEYCIQGWSPYLVSDISSLKQVQRRATKLVQGLKNRPYQERLKYTTHHNTRGHSLRLYVSRSTLRPRQKFFSQRAVNDWNSLPQSVVDASFVNSFRNRLDKYWKDMGI